MTKDVSGRVPDGTGLSSPTEPEDGLGPTGFDPSRWGDLCCAIANARYALEYWEREVRVAFQFLGTMGTEPPKMLVGCIERGRRERETLREMEALVRPIAYPRRDSDGSRNGRDREDGLDGEAATARAEGIAHPPQDPPHE